MKKQIKIITSYSKNFGFGNFYRSKNLFEYLKSRHKTEFFLISNNLEFENLKKKFFFIKNFKDLKISKTDHLFIDVPNLKKKVFKYLIKSTDKIIFYGKNNYFSMNNKRIYSFKNKHYDENYSIINNKQTKIKYNFKKKINFFIYFGKKINGKILKNIIKNLNNLKFNFKIQLFYPNKNYLKINFRNDRKIKIVKSFKKINDNVIFIGNSGSGAYDRVNSGTLSVNYSYNQNEHCVGKQLKKFNNCFYYMGNINKFNSTEFNNIIKKILKSKGINSSKTHGIFKKNNINIERVILK